jgi:nucleoside phosphorylase
MGVELAPVEAMLDKIHDFLPTSRDHNAYTMGKIGGHNLVVAVMPEIGNNAAATVATQLLNDFPSIRFGLLVGTGGGVLGEGNEDDIRLGDVVVSQPTDTFGGVVQYDLGKRLVNGRFERTGQLNKPPAVLSANVQKLQGQHLRDGSQIPVLYRKWCKGTPECRLSIHSPVRVGTSCTGRRMRISLARLVTNVAHVKPYLAQLDLTMNLKSIMARLDRPTWSSKMRRFEMN